jgi:hypothetical protein
MDPLTAALQLANTALALATKVWDATPAPLQAQNASDWAKFTHGIGGFITTIQEKITGVVAKV